jgi:hypothetical protein
MLMMYGYAPETTKDPVIQAADESTRLATTLFDFGGTLINMLPFLYYVPAWVPGAKGKRMIEKVKQLTQDARRIPMEHVKAALVSQHPLSVAHCLTYSNCRKTARHRPLL